MSVLLGIVESRVGILHSYIRPLNLFFMLWRRERGSSLQFSVSLYRLCDGIFRYKLLLGM